MTIIINVKHVLQFLWFQQILVTVVVLFKFMDVWCVVVACHSLIYEVSISLIDCYQQPQSVGAVLFHSCSPPISSTSSVW